MSKIRVTVWCEFVHEKSNETVKAIYPEGIHKAIADHLGEDADFEVKTACLEEPEHGLTEEVLNNTDVLFWWAHCAHEQVEDTIAERVCDYVKRGMGFVALHSSHMAKPFRMLMGTSCTLKWREIGEHERLWVIETSHPIAQGIGDYVDIPQDEMYGERFDIPRPDELVFVTWFQGGEVFRSGCSYQRGAGKVFYFQPGHETYPVYHQKEVIQILKNAAKWAKPTIRLENLYCPNVTEPIEKI